MNHNPDPAWKRTVDRVLGEGRADDLALLGEHPDHGVRCLLEALIDTITAMHRLMERVERLERWTP